MTHETYKKINGSALVYALVIMTAVMILLTSIIGYIAAQLKFSSNRIEREKAFQVAEAGIYYYRWYLAHATDGMNAQQLRTFWQDSSTLGVSGDYTENYSDPETGALIGTYTIHLEPPDISSTIATITSTGESAKMAGVKRTAKARFRRPSWSEYMYIVDGFLNIGSGANVYGKAHSNFGIHMDGVAHNSMTCYVPSFTDPDHSGSHNPEFGVHTHVGTRDPVAPSYPWADGTVPNRPDIFMGGRQFPVPKIDFNGVSADFTNMKNEATANGTDLSNHCTAASCYFNNSYGRRIIFTGSTMSVCRVATYDSTTFGITAYRKNDNSGNCNCGSQPCPVCSGQCAPTNYTIPDNGIIFVDNNVWAEGTVNNKRVTVAANNASGTADIYIGINNIRYTNNDGRDIVGLVAKRNIAIVRDCQNNLRIDGALLAQTGSRFRANYGCSYKKSSLTMNGALASFLQPYVNHGDCGGGTYNGFTTRTYNFDNNLLYYPPPYFPTGTEYSIDLWEEP